MQGVLRLNDILLSCAKSKCLFMSFSANCFVSACNTPRIPQRAEMCSNSPCAEAFRSLEVLLRACKIGSYNERPTQARSRAYTPMSRSHARTPVPLLRTQPAELNVILSREQVAYSSSHCHLHPLGWLSSLMRRLQLHLSPVVMRKPRQRPTFQIALARYQLSSRTWVSVPATDSKLWISRSSIKSILLWNGTCSRLQTCCCR